MMFDLNTLLTPIVSSVYTLGNRHKAVAEHAKSRQEYQSHINKLYEVRLRREVADTNALLDQEIAELLALYEWRDTFLLAKPHALQIQVVMEFYTQKHGFVVASEHAMAERPDLWDLSVMNEYTF